MMTTISLKLDEELAARIDREAARRRMNRSELCREAFERFLKKAPIEKSSLLARSRDLCGAGDSGLGDLSSNASHLEGFGQ